MELFLQAIQSGVCSNKKKDGCTPSEHWRSWTAAPSCDTLCSSSPRQWPRVCRGVQGRCHHLCCCQRSADRHRHSGNHSYNGSNQNIHFQVPSVVNVISNTWEFRTVKTQNAINKAYKQDPKRNAAPVGNEWTIILKELFCDWLLWHDGRISRLKKKNRNKYQYHTSLLLSTTYNVCCVW